MSHWKLHKFYEMFFIQSENTLIMEILVDISSNLFFLQGLLKFINHEYLSFNVGMSYVILMHFSVAHIYTDVLYMASTWNLALLNMETL